METATTPGCLRAYPTAAVIESANPRLLASTSKIFAFGARTCAHSTSNEVSIPFPGGPAGGNTVVLPVCETFLKLGGSGRLNPLAVQYASNAVRSALIDGSS